MRVTPIDANIDLAASDLVRSPGLHMSQIYGALYAELEPERYGDRGDGGPDRTRLGMGFVLEDVLEDAFKRRITNLAGEEAIRPGEFRTAEGVAFSPDYLIMNGGVRLGESKLTWMSCADMPTEEATGLPERFSKWSCQMMAYCHALETNHARLIACFVNGGYEHQRKGARRGQPPTPKLLAYDIEFTARELKTNRDALVNYARSKGWI